MSQKGLKIYVMYWTHQRDGIGTLECWPSDLSDLSDNGCSGTSATVGAC
jgi:hypothetical protein